MINVVIKIILYPTIILPINKIVFKKWTMNGKC